MNGLASAYVVLIFWVADGVRHRYTSNFAMDCLSHFGWPNLTVGSTAFESVLAL